MTIKIHKPSLDDDIFPGNPVLRGVIDPASLPELRIDPHYQREFLSSGTRRSIISALNNHERLPDLELGMRGQTWGYPNADDHSVIELDDPVFLIDGQQRRGSILEYLQRFPEEPVRQGVAIHFGTTMEWERERFQKLNLNQTKVSPNVLLRNLRSNNNAIGTLYGLTNSERSFALYDRVTWAQSATTSQLLSAALFLKTMCYLHSHFAAGRFSALSVASAAAERQAKILTLQVYRENITTFWETVDELWSIRALPGRGAAWLRHGFLMAFSSMISEHRNFWQGKSLQFPHDIRDKLKKFAMDDPEIQRLASGSGAAVQTLEFQLIQHINSGRTVHRLEKHSAYPDGRLRVVGE
jgi:hypothetical protein